MDKRLVIVESPAKAKTIGKYLPGDCEVIATMGHVIDLPASKLGIDIENDFAPQYITLKGKAPILKEIKSKMKGKDEVILATDPDREGEVISWHLANYLGLDPRGTNRIEFHEITPGAIKSAMEHKRCIDMDLVDAQQARRVLDRLVGYQISPVLWKKIMRGLSAGRVQSAATRIIVDREEEIRAFVPEEYWPLSVILTKKDDPTAFEAKLMKIGSKKADLRCEKDATELKDELEKETYTVKSVSTARRKRHPAAPFTTSVLQQDANRKLGFTTKKTMLIAQQLYEGLEIAGQGNIGLITYIRTDSVRVADEARAAAKQYITERFGKEYYQSNVYGKKGNVQDAHEAIRPANLALEPEAVKSSLTREQYSLYSLIYKRFVASQMADAVYDTVSADISAGRCLFRASGSRLVFPGFMRVYDADEEKQENMLPELAKDEVLDLVKVVTEQKFTQPPPRYTEATLVKALEELGIGRPSTYSPTISTIQQRNYVEMEDKKFVPTDLGEAVIKLMKENFTDIVDVGFTAEMEQKLDEVAGGRQNWVEVVRDFYEDLKSELEQSENIQRVKLPEVETDEKCEVCGRNLIIKTGRFGKFLACPGFPDCRFTKPLVEKVDARCPKCGSEIVVRKTKKGRTFYGCKSYPDCDFASWNKPSEKTCPRCGEILYVAKSGKLYCASKDCGYRES
ncbi:MAG: type I DNA topoisomerase [Eubacteriaceae bacterium]|nr:type I DNA topoisomerase [Eubacteriaceae bacterium]